MIMTTLTQHDLTATYTVALEIGHRDFLHDPKAFTESVTAFNTLSRWSHIQSIDLLIGGYDADPRELWDIPEVIDHVARWILASRVMPNHPKLTETSVKLLMVCFRLHHGLPVTVYVTPREEPKPSKPKSSFKSSSKLH